mmetsp:Transcript_7356/g.18420  ORF Transcript_7356/g.18420 Transcript_7356/m.18420 type:complete len:361 (-) Transcript_7356:37-1119(-)
MAMTQVAVYPPGTTLPSDLVTVWNEFEARPIFFKNLHLASDGGYSDVRGLFDSSRFLWAAFSVGCLLLNLTFIIFPNIDVLTSLPFSEWTDTAEEEKFLVVNSIVGLFMEDDRRVRSEVGLAILELGLLLFYLGRTARSCYRATRSGREWRWNGIAALVWDDLPELSSFSAMRSLHYVTPKVLVPESLAIAKRTVHRHGSKYGLPLLTFLALRVIYAFIGFEAFVIKFQTAATSSLTATSFLDAFLSSAAFLNQVLGVVDVNKFAHRRLFVFVFAGEDSFLSDRELTISRTWRAMLAEKCWKASAEYRFRLLWFLAVVLSYTDDDFQKLTLSCAPRFHDLEADALHDKPQELGTEDKAQQ